jgi:hypothetical protein
MITIKLTDKHMKNTVRFLFCNKFKLNHESVEVDVMPISSKEEPCRELIFDFVYNGEGNASR